MYAWHMCMVFPFLATHALLQNQTREQPDRQTSRQTCQCNARKPFKSLTNKNYQHTARRRTSRRLKKRRNRSRPWGPTRTSTPRASRPISRHLPPTQALPATPADSMRRLQTALLQRLDICPTALNMWRSQRESWPFRFPPTSTPACRSR